MHPLFGRRFGLALYALAWIAAGILLGELGRLAVPQPRPFAWLLAVPPAVVLGMSVLSAWWLCRANPLQEGRVGRAVSVQLQAAAAMAAAWAAITGAWGVVVLRGLRHDPAALAAFGREWPLVPLALGLLAWLLSAIVHYLVLGFEATHDAETRLLEAEVAGREAELRALRAQLNPHFLFNSLNSINALVGSDPEGARRMCEGLGDFLRRTLALGARDDVALAEELELVDRYLQIEQVRFGARLAVERVISPQAAACRVPPLLLQPLVENAVKHGVAGCVEGGTLRLVADVRGGALVIAIENPVDPETVTPRGAGVGLENVRRRLDAFGARAARLDAVREDERFTVTLRVPARTGEEQE